MRAPVLTLVLLGAGALLAGCASAPSPGPFTPVAAILRQPCPRPDRPQSPTLGQLAGFSVRQEAAITICEQRKDAAVAVIDAVNAITRPRRPWWRPW